MGYIQFVLSAGKWALGKQKYLNKAWQEATKGGKVVLESQFPKLVNKAKDLYKNFKVAPKVVAPKSNKPSNIIPFPKKPPGKADGGRIDKALPTRSRDI
jgi:hypothetical protein